MRWSLLLGAWSLLVPTLALAQVSQSCEDQLKSVQMELNVADMQLRQLRQTMSGELARVNKRVEQAEQTLAQQHKAAQATPPVAPAAPAEK